MSDGWERGLLLFLTRVDFLVNTGWILSEWQVVCWEGRYSLFILSLGFGRIFGDIACGGGLFWVGVTWWWWSAGR